MDGIFKPASLTGADAAKGILEQLEKLNDPANRKQIEIDIVNAHKLNASEAKKAADARALIKQHQDILDKTINITAQNKKEAEDLAQKQISFKQESESERLKISEEWSKVKDAAEAAKNLHEKAEKMLNDVASREDALRISKEDHAKSVEKLKKDALALEEKRKDIDKYQSDVVAMDNQTKAKVEKLKQFNF